MRAGDTASRDGYQYALFPIDYLRCNQWYGPNTYSHCCGCPVDWGYKIDGNGQPVAPYYTVYPYYAPCDCHRTSTMASNGQTVYTSDDKVWTPSGLKYITFLFAHDNNIPAQTSYRQGELIGHMGTKSSSGTLTGAHLHLDQSLVHNAALHYYGYLSCGHCWALQYASAPQDVFYLMGDETIYSTCGATFQTVPVVPPEPPEPPATGSQAVKLLLLYKLSKKRRSVNGRIKRNSILL